MSKGKVVGSLIQAATERNKHEPGEVFTLHFGVLFLPDTERDKDKEENHAPGPTLGEFAKSVAHEFGPDSVGAKEEGGSNNGTGTDNGISFFHSL